MADRGERAKKGKDRHDEHSHFLEDMNQKNDDLDNHTNKWICWKKNAESLNKTRQKMTMDKEK